MSGIEHPNTSCNRDSLYTATDLICDGWSDISYVDCKMKCIHNEIPASCMNHPDFTVPSEGCAYMFYRESAKWCHLAGNDCIMSEDTSMIWEKSEQGKFVYFGVIGVA